VYPLKQNFKKRQPWTTW